MVIGKEGDNALAIIRLTALWAVGESGLGGMMHALKIPFTGFFVGGLAVILIALIAFYSLRKWTSVLQATLLVLMVKAGVSPHSPVPAYIAVAFQGLAGALLFTVIKNFKVAAIAFSFISLVESAIQKFLFTTLLFGKSVWEGLDIFVESVLNDLHVSSNFSFSFYLVTTYVLLYAIWGLILGIFIGTIPIALAELKGISFAKESDSSVSSAPSKKLRRFLPLLLLIVSLFAVFFFEGMLNKAVYVLLRSVGVTLMLYYLARPIIVSFLNRAGTTRKAELNNVLVLMPEVKSNITPAYKLACANHKGINRYRFFVLYLIAATINAVD
jgi:hypothetical protein